MLHDPQETAIVKQVSAFKKELEKLGDCHDFLMAKGGLLLQTGILAAKVDQGGKETLVIFYNKDQWETDQSEFPCDLTVKELARKKGLKMAFIPDIQNLKDSKEIQIIFNFGFFRHPIFLSYGKDGDGAEVRL